MSFSLFLLLVFIQTLFSQPISGEANKLEFREDRIIYSGDVHLSRGNSILKADKVIVLLDDAGKPKKLIAIGNVVYEELPRKASADYAEYDLTQEVIYLKGNAVVEDGKNLLEAEEIMYDRKNNRLVAKGGKRRVKTIYVEEELNEKIGHSKDNSPGDEPSPE